MNAALNESTRFDALRRDEPMARHSSWRVGGCADMYFKPANLDELRQFLASLPSGTPVTWVGLGSNILVRDGGVRGAVIASAGLDEPLERLDDGRVRAAAGVTCARLARQCVRFKLGPAVFFAGIPGTVGGALAMNAGAFGGETWDNVEAVETVDRSGRLRRRKRAEFDVSYREVRGVGDEWFTSATFLFAAEPDADMSDIKALLAQRNDTQPLGQASCGSVFRNPPESSAGRLIERAGLKGYRIGGAAVSEKHANFIVNDASASAEDIERLIEFVQSEVERKAGVALVPEVRILGDRVRGEPQ